MFLFPTGERQFGGFGTGDIAMAMKKGKGDEYIGRFSKDCDSLEGSIQNEKLCGS